MDYPVLISSSANIYYYTGLVSSNALLMFHEEKRILITDFRYEQAAIKTGLQVEMCKKGQEVWDVALNILEEIDCDTVVYESYDMLAKDFIKFAEKYKMLSVESEFYIKRSLKSESEFNKMLTASKIASNAFDKVYMEIEEGVTERSVAALLDFYMRLEGADGVAFDTIVAFGANASMPHHVPDDTELKSCDCIIIDMGAKFKGYCSDMTRTFFFGEADEKSKEIYNVVLCAQEKALGAIKPGITCNELDAVARDYIKECGYGDFFGHGLGHGVGLEIHEYPRVNQTCDAVLEQGMVITIEPGIYIPGKLGVRIEDMVLVTKDGHYNMTTTDKKLKNK